MYCTQCGTQNPDNARFCSSCGTQLVTVGNEQSLNSPNQLQSSDVLKYSLLGNLEQVSDALWKVRKAAEEGAITASDVEEGIRAFDEWNRQLSAVAERHPEKKAKDIHLPILRFYPVAKEIETFFSNKRWCLDAKGNYNYTTIREDWKLYIGKGLEGLLILFPHMNPSDRQFFVSDLKGLANWVEDELVYHMITDLRVSKVKISDTEINNVTWHRLGVERMKAIVARIGEMDENIKRWKKG